MENLRALDNLQIPTDQWDVLVTYILSEKLDDQTFSKWEEYEPINELPTLDEFVKFIEKRAQLLETLHSKSTPTTHIVQDKPYAKTKNNISRSFLSSNNSCIMCKKDHTIYECIEFNKLEPAKRFEYAKDQNLCINCLKMGHTTLKCKSQVCKKCSLKHHTLLHFPRSQVKQSSQENSLTTMTNSRSSGVLLSTAVVDVIGKYGKLHSCRVLLDSASESNLISRDFFKKLGLSSDDTSISITGINQISTTITSKCNVKLISKFNNRKYDMSCFIMPEISQHIPSNYVDVALLSLPRNIKLADPSFNVPANIDLLLGAECFWTLICVGQIRLGNNLPTLQKTLLGWIISGPIGTQNSNKHFSAFTRTCEIQTSLSRFWELEECALSELTTDEEVACESHFVKTTTRDSNGRFIVSLPLKMSPSELGDSKGTALQRFNSLQRKLNSDASLRKNYIEFMREYESLGHMTKLDSSVKPLFYLPHHGVFKETSTTTKLRVVFDGSCPTSTGISLNDLQMVGPTIQDDILSILIRFRQHKFVIAADIVKMYRQVLISPNERLLQCILWSENGNTPETYQLDTISYGISSSSYLAIRCLKQLALDNAETYPLASKIIEKDFYVDDLLSGGDDLQEVILLAIQVSNILKQGCFILRKWVSNSKQILEAISPSENPRSEFKICTNDNSKTLGLSWSSERDVLYYRISQDKIPKTVTKRNILSSIARIFDPLGLLGPCTIIPKIIMQKLWTEKLSWDESVPLSISYEWLKFKRELPLLNDIAIPRRIICDGAQRVEVHGFADASELAYGACVYLRSIDLNNIVTISLISAKSKVAPLKSQTIPRLELCSALLLSKLVQKVQVALRINIDATFLWSDSTITLGWIRTPPHLLKMFIRSRVSQITNLTNINEWQYVRSRENPADIISRGITPSSLKSCNLWWQGPHWLNTPNFYHHTEFEVQNNLPELAIPKIILTVVLDCDLLSITRFSSFLKLQRCLGYVLRFVNNCKLGRQNRNGNPLSSNELQQSLNHLVRLVQFSFFSSEIHCLKTKMSLHNKSKISPLNPFIDCDGILRVGGRLKNANMPYDKRHPILLPNHHLTKLIFEWKHKKYFHAGPQQLLYLVRENFWPLQGKNIARQIVHKCIRCYRSRPANIIPLMGHLPRNRITPSLPFNTVGIDYAGPFTCKDRKGRGAKISKCYICLFVCFSTKAIHLELVSDLTADLFISALRRFISRRGKPVEIHSDNATNFVGASNQLADLAQFLAQHTKGISDFSTNEGITWRFIPPRSPHFGGLWEAGVKSVKYHLKRVLGEARLTFEEFYTLLTQIEAILNSRPISPLSSDPNDLIPLTPSHFLIGHSLTSIPEVDLCHLPENRLNRYEYIQRLRQHFWQRWHLEYASELQRRPRKALGLHVPEIKEGTMVLIIEDNLPPLCWKLGRVCQLHPGDDKHVRVVSVRTSSGIVRRALKKVCALPLQEDCK